MLYALLADVVVGLHLAFVAAAAGGAFLVLRWPRLVRIHLPILAWAAGVELFGWPCPLTPLEQVLRRAAGEAGYPGGFLNHYLWSLLYPAGLTRTHQVALGAVLLGLNGAVYGVMRRRRR